MYNIQAIRTSQRRKRSQAKSLSAEKAYDGAGDVPVGGHTPATECSLARVYEGVGR